jgi:MFS family permease
MSSTDTSGRLLQEHHHWGVPPTFRALRHRNYRLWFLGQGISLIGTWMQTMAQQILIYRLTGSAVSLGIVTFISVIPLLPMALIGGSLSDRFAKRTLLLATQTAMLVQALILAILTWTGVVEPWHVYIMSFFLGAAKALDMPPRQSFVVEMVEGKEDLTNAIGLNSAIVSGARTVGPALAGVVVAATGEGPAFFINALTFVAVIAGLALMRGLPPPKCLDAKDTQLNRHMAEGVRFVFGEQTFVVLMSLVAVNSFLSQPYYTIMPVFADIVLKESAQPLVSLLCSGDQPLIHCQAPEALPLGMLLAAMGLGAVTGALLVASLPEGIKRGRIMTLGNLGFPLFLLGFSASRDIALSMALLVGVGTCQVLQTSLTNTLLQTLSPDTLRGRVMSLFSLTTQGMQNAGGLQAGFVTDWIGAPLSIGIGAGLGLSYGLSVALRFPKVRQLS